jgi:hypothetical protein
LLQIVAHMKKLENDFTQAWKHTKTQD